jgi:hypothetical protein
MATMSSDLERHWARQWANAGRALSEVRARELRALTDEAALKAADDLLWLFDPASIPQDRIVYSGLVEFQRLLHRRSR